MTIQAQTSILTKDQVTALRGLRLPKQVVRRLQDAGIYCEPSVSIEYQQTAKTYVLRGRESGGATEEVGAYCCFIHADGRAISWIDRIHSVGRNGLHAVLVAPELIRLHACREGQLYSLLITKHSLVSRTGRKRPALESTVLFHEVYGHLALELWGQDSRFSGSALPIFHTRGGEKLPVPPLFEEPVRNVIAAANCIFCDHCHFAVPPSVMIPVGRATCSINELRETGGSECPFSE